MEMDNKLDIKAFLDKDEQKDLLRLLTAGSVDDGKSTLIGRLLFDSKKLYEDQLDALERVCARTCPAGAITGTVRQPHVIDTAKCVKCGACMEKCKFGAISKG